MVCIREALVDVCVWVVSAPIQPEVKQPAKSLPNVPLAAMKANQLPYSTTSEKSFAVHILADGARHQNDQISGQPGLASKLDLLACMRMRDDAQVCNPNIRT